jgi:hypothetical protein
MRGIARLGIEHASGRKGRPAGRVDLSHIRDADSDKAALARTGGRARCRAAQAAGLAGPRVAARRAAARGRPAIAPRAPVAGAGVVAGARGAGVVTGATGRHARTRDARPTGAAGRAVDARPAARAAGRVCGRDITPRAVTAPVGARVRVARRAAAATPAAASAATPAAAPAATPAAAAAAARRAARTRTLSGAAGGAGKGESPERNKHDPAGGEAPSKVHSSSLPIGRASTSRGPRLRDLETGPRPTPRAISSGHALVAAHPASASRAITPSALT